MTVIPKLPEVVVTRYGHEVRITGEEWLLKTDPSGNSEAVLSLAQLLSPPNKDVTRQLKKAYPRRRSIFDQDVIQLIILFLCHRLRRDAPETVINIKHAFVSLELYVYTHKMWRRNTTSRISAADLMRPQLIEGFVAYRGRISRNTHSYGSHMRSFYEWGLKSGFAGFDAKSWKQLRAMTFRNPHTSDRAPDWDANKGAFQWEELQQIRLAFARNAGSERNRSIVWLFYETYMRPKQAAQLVRSQICATPNPERWRIAAPKGKSHTWTAERDDKFITAELAHLLLKVSGEAEYADDNTLIFHWLKREHKEVVDGLRQSVHDWGKEANIVRADGKKRRTLLNLTPYRFRRNGATSLADDGADVEEIAMRLGHETTHTARRYVQETSNLVEILRETLDRHPYWCRILNLFEGSLDLSAKTKGLPEILGVVAQFGHLPVENKDLLVVGHCSNKRACKIYPPLSCYTCPKFIASGKERAHKLLLDQLSYELDNIVGRESDRMVMAMLPYMAAIVSVISRIREELGLTPTAYSTSSASAAIYGRED